MTPRAAPTDEFLELMYDLAENRISQEQLDRLEELLRADRANYQHYVDFMAMVTRLRWVGDDQNTEASLASMGQTPESYARRLIDGDSGLGSEHRVIAFPEIGLDAGLPISTDRAFPLVHNITDWCSSGWPAAYLIATVILAIGALIGSFIYVSQPTEFANQRYASSVQSVKPNSLAVVARITGTADCRWERKQELGIRDWGLEGREERGEGRGKVQGSRSKVQNRKIAKFPNSNPQSLIPNPSSTTNHYPLTTPHKSLVSLGDQFVLSAGLMEITYNTGAKVILQGPCTFEVDSADGGFLTIGKLTARVEERGVRKGEREDTRFKAGKSLKPEIPKSLNPQLTTHHSPLTTHSSPLFTVRTPTAIVTDLGTEFGVEVDRESVTTTHVFSGAVRVEGTATEARKNQRVLLEGEAVRWGAEGEAVVACEKQRFVREMPLSEQQNVPDLISQVDYSDTWTANSPTRPGSYLIMGEPSTLLVENCHGNPPRSWVFSCAAAMTTYPWDNSPVPWPGHRTVESKTGMCESGCDLDFYMSIEYGLRDDFVVQFDAVQTADRINISIGDDPATIAGGNMLSVFFRQDNHGTLPAIGIYSPERGEVDAGISSGVAKPWQWHNYAVRFNIPAKALTIWVDRQCRGTVELGAVATNTKDGPKLRWADLPLSNRFVTVGGSDRESVTRIWVDSFRVGSPAIDPKDVPDNFRKKAAGAMP